MMQLLSGPRLKRGSRSGLCRAAMPEARSSPGLGAATGSTAVRALIPVVTSFDRRLLEAFRFSLPVPDSGVLNLAASNTDSTIITVVYSILLHYISPMIY
jgi:hypothetical protein